MTGQRILIAGIGNIFAGDDAFGVEVAQRMLRRAWPADVRVVDFGIRGFDLAYALLDDPDATIMVDASQRGKPPGTLYLIEPELDQTNNTGELALDTHGMSPMKVLQLVKNLGGQPRNLLLVGCEPATLEAQDGQFGLSGAVQAAVEPAIDMIASLIERIRAEYRTAEQVNTNGSARS